MEATTTQTTSPDGFKVPYASFKTLINTFDRMAEEGGVPSRVDRSYLSNLPGGEQTIFLATLKSLNLVDDNQHPTATLERLVAEPDSRQEIIGELLNQYYAGALGLGKRATQAQLEEEFRKFNISGSTMRRAIAFFLAAARFAEIEVSPNFKLPKRPPRKRTPVNEPVDRTPEKDEDRGDKLPPGYNPLLGQGVATDQLHPFLVGLLRELPADGGSWTTAKRDAWLEIAERTVDMLYTVTGSSKASVPDAGGGDDDS